MATVATERDTDRTRGGTGRVVRIIGPVIDVEFAPDELPAINHALTVERTLGNEKNIITCEVAQHIGDAMVRAIAMSPTDGLIRGAPVQDTGAAMTMPVGEQTLGHVFNVMGQALDAPDTHPARAVCEPHYRLRPRIDRVLEDARTAGTVPVEAPEKEPTDQEREQ